MLLISKFVWRIITALLGKFLSNRHHLDFVTVITQGMSEGGRDELELQGTVEIF